MDLVITSNEDLGRVHLDFTDASGDSEGSLSAGSWDIELNHTEGRTRYVIDKVELIDGGLVSGDNGLIQIVATTYVEMSGTIFWDHDDDDDADVGEGVPDVGVMMSSEGEDNISITTDSTGEWNVFVPFNSSWQISTHREGFAQENVSVAMNAPNSIEIELTAGHV